MSSKRGFLRGHTGREKRCGWKGCKCSVLVSEIPKLKKGGGDLRQTLFEMTFTIQMRTTTQAGKVWVF